jgi:hypothetical protein
VKLAAVLEADEVTTTLEVDQEGVLARSQRARSRHQANPVIR